MTTATTPTESDMRTRTKEMAHEVYVDHSDDTEPLQELIERVRAGIENEREQMTALYSEFESELDEFENTLAANQEKAS